MVAMDRSEYLENMINIAVKINNRQYDKFVDKKIGPNPSQKIKYNLKKILWSLTLQKKIKNNCYVCGKLGHFKTKLPKKTVKM